MQRTNPGGSRELKALSRGDVHPLAACTRRNMTAWKAATGIDEITDQGMADMVGVSRWVWGQLKNGTKTQFPATVLQTVGDFFTPYGGNYDQFLLAAHGYEIGHPQTLAALVTITGTNEEAILLETLPMINDRGWQGDATGYRTMVLDFLASEYSYGLPTLQIMRWVVAAIQQWHGLAADRA